MENKEENFIDEEELDIEPEPYETEYGDYYAEYLSSGYEFFEDFIYDKIEDAKDDGDKYRVNLLYGVLQFYRDKSENQPKELGSEQTTERVNNKLLDDMTTEELVELVTKNQGTILENELVIKDALIKRILDQQQHIAEQESEIKRLREQKVI